MAVPKRPGIYLLLNKANGKIYVGQSINLFSRKGSHRKGFKKGDNLLSRAIRKHGWNNFEFSVIELAEEDLLDEREIYWIFTHQSNDTQYGYNMTPGGKSIHCLSKAIRAKMSRNHADVSGKKNPFYGKSHDRETRDIMSMPRSPEGKIAVANSNIKNKGFVVEQVDPFTFRTMDVWPSARAAATNNNCSYTPLTKRCNKMDLTPYAGYIWKYDKILWNYYYNYADIEPVNEWISRNTDLKAEYQSGRRDIFYGGP